MKNFASVLLVLLAALMFFNCNTDDDDKDKKDTVYTVSLDKTTHTMEVNENVLLVATTTPAGGTVSWSSSDIAKATVSDSGFVRGISVGEATITASIKDEPLASCVVTITKATKNYTEVEGQTLVHYLPRIAGVNHFGGDQGTNNDDGTYTFNGTAGDWGGGGAGYAFPTPVSGIDTWKISDYATAEIHYTITGSENNFQAKLAKGTSSEDLTVHPGGGGQYLTLPNGSYKAKVQISNAGTGISFQRRSGGPATIKVDKVVFEKLATFTISFTGGTYAAMPEIAPITVFDGGKIDLNAVPDKPKYTGHIFKGFKDTVNSADWSVDFLDTAISKNYTFVAQWETGTEVPVSMKLDLNPANWPSPLPPAAANQSNGVTWPSNYAVTEYDTSTGKLKVSFDGKNRQRAIFPLSKEQIEELLLWTKGGGVTFNLSGTIKGEDGLDSDGRFRCHLADPSSTAGWNGTVTGSEGALIDRMTEYNNFDANKSKSTLAWFVIQAMYYDPDTSQTNIMDKTFPKVIMTFDSITIEPSN